MEVRMIAVTEKAAGKVQEIAREMPEAEGKDLRIFIQGQGCSGYAYGFTFDEEQEGDTVVEASGLRVLLDANSAPLLEGSTVDFVDDERGSGFTVDNPNQPAPDCSGCSCG
jgi:iron-sulfur cluster assembly accessory protein